MPSRKGWEAGSEYVHDLDYQMQFSPGEEEKPSGSGIEIRIRGQFKTVVSEQRERETRVKIELSNIALETPSGSAAEVEATKRALARPFFVDYDARGRALRAHTEPGIDTMAIGILREIIGATQFSSPEKPATRWNAIEIDPGGEYQAAYVARSERSFSRQKTRYERVAGAKGLVAAERLAPVIRAYTAELTLDDWGRVASLKQSADVSTPPSSGVAFRARTKLALKNTSRGKSSAKLPLSMEGLVETSLYMDKNDVASAARNGDRDLVAGANASTILSDLDGVGADDAGARSGVRSRLAASFRLDPNGISQTMKRLKPENASTILGALGSAGTPEAQKALAEVTRDEHRSATERQAAIDSMLAVEEPIGEMPEALKTAMRSSDQELKTNASLMLGVMARRMSEQDPAQAEQLVNELTSDLKSTSDPAEQQRALGSLGNTGSAQSLPAIAQSLASSDPNVRAAAATALRFVPGPEADRLLSNVITSDPVTMVRSAALIAAGYRSYEPLAVALENVAKNEPASTLRSQLVMALANMVARDGEALILLDWIAQHDSDEKVRAQAKQAIEAAGTL